MLDDPHPEGSTGLTEAMLALTYDPTVISVASADITLGSIASLESGWQIASVVDAAKGEIGIELFSSAPITAAQGGSLVNLRFHITNFAPAPTSTEVRLVDAATPHGQFFATHLSDAEGSLALSGGTNQAALAVPCADSASETLLDPSAVDSVVRGAVEMDG